MDPVLWRSQAPRLRRTYAVAPIGLLILSILMFSKPQYLVSRQPSPDEQALSEFTLMVREEAQTLETGLRIALHEDVPCEGPCNRDEDFANVVTLLIIRCQRFDPEAQEQSPYYRQDLHGEDLNRLKVACSILTDMADKTASDPSPDGLTALNVSETSEWMEAVTRARAVFGTPAPAP